MSIKRISWNRFQGKLPENTKSVMRPSKFGNPFKLKDFSRKESIEKYKDYLVKKVRDNPGFLYELDGYNLACSCKIGELCHADILVKLVNVRMNDLKFTKEQKSNTIRLSSIHYGWISIDRPKGPQRIYLPVHDGSLIKIGIMKITNVDHEVTCDECKYYLEEI